MCRRGHWAFEGTDLRYGDELGRDDTIVAYEVDGHPVVAHALDIEAPPEDEGG